MKYLGLKDDKWLSSDALFSLDHRKDDVGSCHLFFKTIISYVLKHFSLSVKKIKLTGK